MANLVWRTATLWLRFKQWLRNQVIRLVWRIASTRIYRSLRRLVAASLPFLATIAAATLIGMGIASSAGFVVIYGALIGAGSGFLAFVLFKLAKTVVERVQYLRNLHRRITFQRNEQTASRFSRSSLSRRRRGS